MTPAAPPWATPSPPPYALDPAPPGRITRRLASDQAHDSSDRQSPGVATPHRGDPCAGYPRPRRVATDERRRGPQSTDRYPASVTLGPRHEEARRELHPAGASGYLLTPRGQYV